MDCPFIDVKDSDFSQNAPTTSTLIPISSPNDVISPAAEVPAAGDLPALVFDKEFEFTLASNWEYIELDAFTIWNEYAPTYY